MKRLLALILTIVLALSMVSGACAEAAKDSLTLGTPNEADVFFPAHSSLVVGSEDTLGVSNIYESTIRLMPDGSLRGLLAETWEISEDGLVYTLHLRKGVTFQDGNPMTSEDVVFSLETSAPTYNGRAQLINYDHAEAVDEYTVNVYLTAAYAPFIKGLTGRASYIFEKKLYEEIGEDAYNEKPVGTGPYMLESRVPGDRMTLTAYDGYWGGKPAIKTIVCKTIPDGNARMIALENGEIDVLQNGDFAAMSMLPEDSEIGWLTNDAVFMAALDINCNKGPGADKNFRKALQYGINRDDIILGVWEGLASPLYMFCQNSFTGKPAEGSYTKIDYDAEKAKQYLAESGYQGEEFVIATISGTNNEKAVNIIQGQLIEMGINCKVTAVDSASYFAIVRDGDGSYGASLRATGVSVYDADGMYRIYNSKGYSGIYNPGWSSDRVDELTATARVTVDETARSEMYAEVANIVNEEAYQVFLYNEVACIAFNKNVKGVNNASNLWFNEWSW